MDTTTPARASSTNLIRVASIAALALLCVPNAQAQAVHKCVVEGRIVYQSSLCPATSAATAASAPVALAATAPNAGAPKKKSLADLLHERDGATRAAPAQREAEGDGANILRSRMGAV